jgi:MFS family permease
MLAGSNRVHRLSLGLSGKRILSLLVLVSNGFIWFFASSIMLAGFSSSFSYFYNFLILITNAGGTAAAVLVAGSLLERFANIRFLETWMAVGALASVVPLAVDMNNPFTVALVALLWGVTLGFGMPASMDYLTECTAVENRGRIGAIVFFVTLIGLFGLGMIFQPQNYQVQTIILGILRFAGLVVFFLLNPPRISTDRKIPSYLAIVRERPFITYFSAWILFALVNYLSVPILNRHFGEDFARSYATIESIIAAISVLVGGFLCDTVGRKIVVTAGFVMLGLGYAVLGVFPSLQIGWYFYTVVDGIAFGTLGVVFFMVLWGDLAYARSSKKYFALGGLPLLFSNVLQKLIGPDLASSVPVTAVFSLSSIFLFLAVLPLLYAPETLSEKKIKERELRRYLEKAKKIKEKYT